VGTNWKDGDSTFSDEEIDARDDYAESNCSVHCIGELEKEKGMVGSRRNVFSLGLYGYALCPITSSSEPVRRDA
jgi:hypothetical protein